MFLLDQQYWFILDTRSWQAGDWGTVQDSEFKSQSKTWQLRSPAVKSFSCGYIYHFDIAGFGIVKKLHAEVIKSLRGHWFAGSYNSFVINHWVVTSLIIELSCDWSLNLKVIKLLSDWTATPLYYWLLNYDAIEHSDSDRNRYSLPTTTALFISMIHFIYCFTSRSRITENRIERQTPQKIE
jgi:hypothetical protein